MPQIAGNHGKIMENHGKIMENHRKSRGKNHGKSWKIMVVVGFPDLFLLIIN